jgi:hypothetical protein
MVVVIPEQECTSCEAPDLLLEAQPDENIVISWSPVQFVEGYRVYWDKGIEGILDSDFEMLEINGSTLITDRKASIPIISSSINYRFKVVG